MKSVKYLLCLLGITATAFTAAAEIQLNNVDSFYPRAIRLQASGAANGRLIASVDVAGAGNIYESTNDGVSWQQVGTASEPQSPCCSALYEVPRNLGSTTAGTLFWATSINLNGGGPRGLRIYKSTNTGRNWSFHSNPVSGGSSGLWEAEFAIDSIGRLVIYYSSEEHKGEGFNQIIAHKTSSDGGLTWSGETYDVALGGGIQRPGMPVVRKMPNGSYIMTYEVCGSSNCEVYMRTSLNGTDWGNAGNIGTRIETASGHHLAHAPTINWINNGTPNGLLVVMGQTVLNANNSLASNNGKIFVVNDNNGAGLWKEMSAPLFTPNDGTDPCNNYSTQLIPSQNGQEIIQVANRGCRMLVSRGPLISPIKEGVYRLVSQNSNKVLDVSGCSQTNGANVQQWSWLGGDCQRWKLENAGNGEYRILAQHSGQALDVAGCSQANGGNVQQWTSLNNDCQRWKIEEVGNGYYRLIAKHSGKVLDVNACSTADGGNVQQWDWIGGNCQRWRFEPVSGNSVDTNPFYSIKVQHSNQVLDVTGCSNSDGAQMEQWPLNSAPCQQWKAQATSDGFYQLISRQSNKALDVDNCSANSGGKVQQWTQNTADCQRWSIERVEPGYYKIVSKFSGKVLDVNACSQTAGAIVQQWEWLGGACQRWALNPVTN